ncbi:MAG: apolipoprotein N-acyltransferase [Gammaproteobacteria bacterium]|nr:apolipoprotein N-acyltransferase [Gammaproteobacteria bacterium]
MSIIKIPLANKNLSDILVALGAGAALPLAFAPFDFAVLAILSPSLLFLLWRRGSPWRCFGVGLAFGLGSFGVGVSWVYRSMHDYGGMSVPLAALAVALFVLLLSLFPALVGGLQARFGDRKRVAHLIVVLPALWVLLEWCRSWVLTGFPWLSLGYSQIDTPLSGVASGFGIYAVSLSVALVAGLLALIIDKPRRPWPALVLVGVFGLGFLLGRIEWVEPKGPMIKVALVQGNVPLDMKWSPRYRMTVAERYLHLSQEYRDQDLIVWPEVAIPAFKDQIPPSFWRELKNESTQYQTDFLYGTLERRQGADGALDYYNVVRSIASQPQTYHKHHLVPFGEYLPFPVLTRWLMGALDIPMSDFSPWPDADGVMHVAGQAVAVSICYEDAFPEEFIRLLPEATLLVNVSEDAWFGDSLGPLQRLQMARMRALETGRTLLRVANTGVTAIINHRGKIIAHTEQFKTVVLSGEVQPMQGATPYVRWGNKAVLMLIGGMLVLGWVGSWGLSRKA